MRTVLARRQPQYAQQHSHRSNIAIPSPTPLLPKSICPTTAGAFLPLNYRLVLTFVLSVANTKMKGSIQMPNFWDTRTSSLDFRIDLCLRLLRGDGQCAELDGDGLDYDLCAGAVCLCGLARVWARPYGTPFRGGYARHYTVSNRSVARLDRLPEQPMHEFLVVSPPHGQHSDRRGAFIPLLSSKRAATISGAFSCRSFTPKQFLYPTLLLRVFPLSGMVVP